MEGGEERKSEEEGLVFTGGVVVVVELYGHHHTHLYMHPLSSPLLLTAACTDALEYARRAGERGGTGREGESNGRLTVNIGFTEPHPTCPLAVPA